MLFRNKYYKDICKIIIDRRKDNNKYINKHIYIYMSNINIYNSLFIDVI